MVSVAEIAGWAALDGNRRGLLAWSRNSAVGSGCGIYQKVGNRAHATCACFGRCIVFPTHSRYFAGAVLAPPNSIDGAPVIWGGGGGGGHFFRGTEGVDITDHPAVGTSASSLAVAQCPGRGILPAASNTPTKARVILASIIAYTILVGSSL